MWCDIVGECELCAAGSSVFPFFPPSSLVEQRVSASILPGHCFSYAWEGAKVFWNVEEKRDVSDVSKRRERCLEL